MSKAIHYTSIFRRQRESVRRLNREGAATKNEDLNPWNPHGENNTHTMNTYTYVSRHMYICANVSTFICTYMCVCMESEDIRSVCRAVSTVIQSGAMQFSALSRSLMKGGCYLKHTTEGCGLQSCLYHHGANATVDNCSTPSLASHNVQLKLSNIQKGL